MPFVRVARPGKKLGRPRSVDSGVWHVRRPEVSSRLPMLVTMKLCAGLPSLRSREESEIFFAALRRANRDHDVRIVHWVLLSNHMHLIVEGDDRRGVQKAMQGLAISRRRPRCATGSATSSRIRRGTPAGGLLCASDALPR